MIAQFEVYGSPAPQGSKSPYVGRDGKAHLLEGSSETGRQKFKDWREDVKQAAEAWMLQHRVFEPVGVPVHLYLVFRFQRPASYPKRKTKYGALRRVLWGSHYVEWHGVKPDLDKLVRLAKDSLTSAGLYRDDALVCGVIAFKVFGENCRPGVTIGLRIPVEPDEFSFPFHAKEHHGITS